MALAPSDGSLLAVSGPYCAVAESYPIGSLAKVVTALAATDLGLADERRIIYCRGRYHNRRCWRAHGPTGLDRALAESCSVYFFELGRELGARRIAAAFRAAGFGASTRSGLAGEQEGLVEEPVTTADTLDLAYGDTRRLLATPMQVAVLAGALANGGTRFRPHWGKGPVAVLGHLPWRHLSAINQALRRCVLLGTGSKAQLPAVPIAGKTGTATDLANPAVRLGWFMGYAPGIAVAVFVRYGRGYDRAAPIARRVFEAWNR